MIIVSTLPELISLVKWKPLVFCSYRIVKKNIFYCLCAIDSFMLKLLTCQHKLTSKLFKCLTLKNGIYTLVIDIFSEFFVTSLLVFISSDIRYLLQSLNVENELCAPINKLKILLLVKKGFYQLLWVCLFSWKHLPFSIAEVTNIHFGVMNAILVILVC